MQFASSGLPSLADAGGRVTFEFSKEQGAALRVRTPTFRQDLEVTDDVKRFVTEEYDNWLQYAHNQRGLSSIPMGQLLFVTGVHKTAQFNAFAYVGASRGLELQLNVGTSGLASIELGGSHTTVSSTTWSAQAESPPGNPMLNLDQCIFLRACSVQKRTWPSWRRISIPTSTLTPQGSNAIGDASHSGTSVVPSPYSLYENTGRMMTPSTTVLPPSSQDHELSSDVFVTTYPGPQLVCSIETKIHARSSLMGIDRDMTF
jgi:hypothetical protein